MGHNLQVSDGRIDKEVVMAKAQHKASGGGLFSKLVILVLLGVTLGLYLKIVVIDEQGVTSGSLPQASVQVVEGTGDAAPSPALKTIPEDQMALIQQVFAPETSNK